eukprot:scaffold45705_cov229-Amphora_coffeaeformis.AAC.1
MDSLGNITIINSTRFTLCRVQIGHLSFASPRQLVCGRGSRDLQEPVRINVWPQIAWVGQLYKQAAIPSSLIRAKKGVSRLTIRTPAARLNSSSIRLLYGMVWYGRIWYQGTIPHHPDPVLFSLLLPYPEGQ